MARDPRAALADLYDALAEDFAESDAPDPPRTLDEAREGRRRADSLRDLMLGTCRTFEERRARRSPRAL